MYDLFLFRLIPCDLFLFWLNPYDLFHLIFSFSFLLQLSKVACWPSPRKRARGRHTSTLPREWCTDRETQCSCRASIAGTMASSRLPPGVGSRNSRATTSWLARSSWVGHNWGAWRICQWSRRWLERWTRPESAPVTSHPFLDTTITGTSNEHICATDDIVRHMLLRPPASLVHHVQHPAVHLGFDSLTERSLACQMTS